MKAFVTATAIAALPVLASAATVQVDDFYLAQGDVVASGGAAVTDGPVGPISSGFMRTLTVDHNPKAGLPMMGTPTYKVNVAGGFMNIDPSFNGGGVVTVDYALTAGTIDMTDGGVNDRFRLQRFSDTGLDIAVSVNGGALTSFASAGNGMYEAMFGDIVGDESAVTSLQFVFTDTSATNSTDAFVSFLGAVAPEPVPLPAGGALLLAGLGAFGIARRRK